MEFDLPALIRALELEPRGADTFRGQNLPLGYRRVFGGQVLAQGIAALALCVDGKQVKSLTQHFTREGDVEQPVDYRVETVQSGRTFATCIVTAAQGDRVIGTMTASLHAPEEGWEQSLPMPPIPTPEQSAPRDLRIMPWETRVVDDVDLNDPSSRPAEYRLWMRAPDVGDDDAPWLHQALLAHASEPTIIGTALLPIAGVGQSDATVRFTSAVTTHTLWFHRPVRLDDWLVVDQHSPTMTGGRAFGRADVWTRDGTLVASWAQESLVRPLRG
jgi:acyl-CoA thioesterase-2